ncbi:4Fe-4S binding protein [Clostridium ljungdahlii]|uniref:4Fe-4S binding protein n=1 Tax=Clostridium ljungdahlii TaxID=1538 RepID=UPI0038648A3C
MQILYLKLISLNVRDVALVQKVSSKCHNRKQKGRINKDKCVGCASCMAICPQGAI